MKAIITLVLVFDLGGSVFLSRRGPAARNKVGFWEFPGGGVNFGEKMVDAMVREFREVYDMEIEVQERLSISDHLLPDEHQHWISTTYVARYKSGVPRIVEPNKCNGIGWFTFASLPSPLSLITRDNIASYYKKYGGTLPPIEIQERGK